MSVFDLKAWMQPHLERVEQALSQGIAADSPAQLGEAMRYAVLDGGKRLRPLLVLATAEAVGDAPQSAAALNAACALELIHAYSLVHDDMHGQRCAAARQTDGPCAVWRGPGPAGR
jgi:farnesyl diphosphate synthase